MFKKVLVLTSSGRANSNSTAMADAFSAAARESGHQVSCINLFDLSIDPCSGCAGCRKGGTPCAHDDDFSKVANEILAADVIVFAAPLYWYTFPAKMKLAIDKCVSFLWGGHPIQGRQAVLLSTATEDDVEYAFKGIVTAYECTVEHLGWTSAGMVLQGSIPDPGDVAKTDALERCAALARSL